MNDIHSFSCCPDCGAPLPADSPQALCPACLLRQALASRTIHENRGADFTPPTPEEIADKFPQFEITGCLGRGGMGVVYKARQKSLDRWVAIKILPPERIGEEKFSERFAREAQTLARLNHPNIVTVFDYGETDGLFYIVMEFVDGVNLRDLLRDGKLEPKQALAIVPPICEALQYAHEKGIVHRDIKPENLLLDRDGRIKIADFGIASLIGAGAEKAGTPPYMAPEQSGGSSGVDHRADIYALGVVFYEMLTGERPETDLVAPSRKVHLDVRLDEMVLRALEKEPERRYQTAGEFRTVVEAAAAGVQVSAPFIQHAPAEISSAPRFSRRAIVGACFIPVFFVAGYFWLSIIAQGGVWPEGHWDYMGSIPSTPGNMAIMWLSVLGIPLSLLTVALGWSAVSQIRSSAGKTHGMWLAVFDGLFCPLLLLDWLIGYLVRSLGIPFLFINRHHTVEINAKLIMFTLVVSLIIDFLIIRIVWRVVNRSLRKTGPVGTTPSGGNAMAGCAPWPTDDLLELSPRFSRKATIGACWAPLFFGVIMMFAVSKVVEGYHGPAWWQKLLMVTLLPLGCTAPLGTTLLGWIAVSQIRRSAGKIHGMWLAVFDGLLFPLLALDWVIAWLIHTSGIAFHFWTQNYTDESNAKLILLTVVFSLIADFLIIRAIWQAVNRPLNSPPVGNTAPRWNPVVMLVCGLAGFFLFFAFLAMVWQRQSAEDSSRRSEEFSENIRRGNQAAIDKVEAEQKAGDFGPEMERTLKSPAVDRSMSYFNLENRIPIVPSPDLDLHDLKAVWEWSNGAGVDVVADTDEKVRGLLGFGLHVANVPDSEWEQGSMESIGRAVMAEEFRYDKMGGGKEINQWVISANTVSTDPQRTHTFAIRTRKGTLGLLQLLQISDEPGGFVKFRYKLVR